MDKKTVINSLSSTRKRKPNKNLVESIRKDAFQNAYPDQIEMIPETKVEKQNENASSEIKQGDTPEKVEEPKNLTQHQQDVEAVIEESSVAEESHKTSAAKPEAKKSNRGRKRKAVDEGSNHEFTTLNCTQNTLNRAKISSALTKTPMYQFVDEAVDYYIRHLKKTGKITLDI